MGLLSNIARTILMKVGDVPQVDAFADMARLLDARDVRTVLDVGGCVGELALRFEGMFPNATVYSFEPSPATWPKLGEAVAGHDRIVPVNAGCWSEAKTATLHINEWHGATSLLERNQDDLPYHNPVAVHVDEVEVPLVALDDWAAEQGVTSIDLIKIDIQGVELEALKGASKLLETCSAVYVEVQFHPNYEGACLLDEVWGFLRTKGFSLFQLYEAWGASNGQLVQGDALFISDAVRRAKLMSDEPFRSVRYLN